MEQHNNIGSFRILHRETNTHARLGVLQTAHGPVETPVFMPVGTQATVKSITPHELHADDQHIILANTYHLFVRPGDDLIARCGGLHAFMGWDRAILTDSGGFQVWSLATLNNISEKGVTFQSHVDGSTLFLGPVESMRVQRNLGSDIAMVFDECIPYPSEKSYAQEAVNRTLRWAAVCREQPRALGQLYFGIVQGGVYPDLREQCAKELTAMDFDGYAVGGVSVGEPDRLMAQGIQDTVIHLPEDKPRYVMGLGVLDQMLDAVEHGVDMFDCVIPTRYARNGNALTRKGRVVVRNACYKEDLSPIEEDCGCYTCAHFTRAYLRHLLNVNEILGLRLITLHNLHCYKQFMEDVKQAIRENALPAFKKDFLAHFQRGPIEKS